MPQYKTGQIAWKVRNKLLSIKRKQNREDVYRVILGVLAIVFFVIASTSRGISNNLSVTIRLLGTTSYLLKGLM